MYQTPTLDFQYLSVASGDWVPGLNYTYQGALIDIPLTEIFNRSDLPTGKYTYYFAVDMNMNGVLDIEELYADMVVVNIE